MKRKNIINIVAGIIFVALIVLGYTIQKQKNKTIVFPLQDIKLGKIIPQSKQVLTTTNFLRGDEFLLSFKNLNQESSLILIISDYNNQQDILLTKTSIHSGDNQICCFEVPKLIGRYDLRILLDNQEKIIPFEVKDKIVEYQTLNLRGIGSIPYPNWQTLDPEIINNLLVDVFSYYSKDLGKGITTLLALQDDTGAQFTITQRIVSNYKNLPFGNLVQVIETNENQALLKAHIIDDYTILDKQYGNKEIYFKIRNISKGISYIVFNKTYLVQNFFNKKFLLSVSLTCPERLADFYKPIADYIFSQIKITNSPN